MLTGGSRPFKASDREFRHFRVHGVASRPRKAPPRPRPKHSTIQLRRPEGGRPARRPHPGGRAGVLGPRHPPKPRPGHGNPRHPMAGPTGRPAQPRGRYGPPLRSSADPSAPDPPRRGAASWSARAMPIGRCACPARVPSRSRRPTCCSTRRCAVRGRISTC